MLKKTITFKDLDGNDVTEDFYFNLNKAEIAELELSHENGLSGHLRKIIDSRDGQKIIETFKEIVLLSVGRRSEDGRRFVKSEEIKNEFLQTDAYSELFMELVTDADAAAAFVRGIVPEDVRGQVEKGGKVTPLETVEPKWPNPDEDDETPAWIKEERKPTDAELMSMSREELMEAFRRHPKLAAKGRE